MVLRIKELVVTLVGGSKTIIESILTFKGRFKKSKDLGQKTYPKLLVFSSSKVNWPMTKHLSTQGRLDPGGGLHYLWCPKKI
jgi:hypothetical protein